MNALLTKYLCGFFISICLTFLIYLPVNHPVNLNLDSNFYYGIANRYLKLEFKPDVDLLSNKKLAIFTTNNLSKIKEDVWSFIKNSNPDSVSCLFAIQEDKNAVGKVFNGAIKLQSDQNVKIQVLLCNHNVGFEGTSANYNLQAGVPLDINLSHMFQYKTDAVKLQVNFTEVDGQNANIKIHNLTIKEENNTHLSLLKKMSHFIYPISVAFVKKLTGFDVSSSGVIVMFALQILLASVFYISLFNARMSTLFSPIQAILLTTSLLVVSHIPALYFLDKHLYFGYIAPTVFHNATMATLKPFALMLFLVALKIFEKDINIIPVIFVSCILLFLSTFSKPSFTIILLPAIFILVFISLLHKKPLNWSVLIFGIILPAISILGFQYYLTYSGPKESGLEFRPFAVMLNHSGYLGIKFLLSIAFPLAVLLLYNKKALHDNMLNFAWLIAIFGFVFTYFFAESGSRFAHGNFGWSGQIGAFILFYASIIFLMKSASAGCFKNWRSLLADKRLFVCLSIYLVHCCSGLIWWYSTASLCFKNISPRIIW